MEIDPPQSGEVKVRIRAVAICHSDIHLFNGDWGGLVPVIAGHDAAGVIEEVGGPRRVMGSGMGSSRFSVDVLHYVELYKHNQPE